MGPLIEGVRRSLEGQGYTSGTVRNILKDVGHLGRWLATAGLDPGQLDEEAIDAFIESRRNEGASRLPTRRSLRPILLYLRQEGLLAERDSSEAPLDRLVQDY